MTDELGFHAGLDHKAPEFADRLVKACPQGVDIYFENVGGKVWSAVFPLLNNFARVPVCGLIAHYNDTGPPPGPDRTSQVMDAVLVKRLTLRGYIVSDFAAQTAAFVRDVSGWLRDGKLKYREDVVVGLRRRRQLSLDF